MRIVIYWIDFLHYHVARINTTCKLAKGLGHEVIPVAVRPGSPELPLSGYQYLLQNKPRILASNPQSGSMQSRLSARQMEKVLQEINPDVVVIPGYDTRVALASLEWCRRNNRGAVLMTESQKKDFPRIIWKEWLKRILLMAFDAAIVGGTPHKEYLEELGVKPDRIFSGYDAVDNDFWALWADKVHKETRLWRESLGLPELFFLTACRLVPKKNVSGLIKAYAGYASNVVNPWPLVIAGDGPLRIELEILVKSFGIANKVRFMGYLSADEMGRLYGLASVFILASAYAEQWGLVVNEAMAAGLPVLVSSICGCAPDLVHQGINGFQFDPENTGQLIKLLLLFHNGQVDIKKMGTSAQAIIENFSSENFAVNVLKASETALYNVKKHSTITNVTVGHLMSIWVH